MRGWVVAVGVGVAAGATFCTSENARTDICFAGADAAGVCFGVRVGESVAAGVDVGVAVGVGVEDIDCVAGRVADGKSDQALEEPSAATARIA